jgi:broad specificity phosphatase PhoE
MAAPPLPPPPLPQQQHTLHCRILRAERIGDHTKYLICGAVDGHECPPVRRRYREFAKIWGALRKHLAKHASQAAAQVSSAAATSAPPVSSSSSSASLSAAAIAASSSFPAFATPSVVLPDLPPKKMFGQMSSGFVTKRMKALERALQAVCANSAFKSFPRLHVFLGIEAGDGQRGAVSYLHGNSTGFSADGSSNYDEEVSGEATAGDDSTAGTTSSVAAATEEDAARTEEWGALLLREDADFGDRSAGANGDFTSNAPHSAPSSVPLSHLHTPAPPSSSTTLSHIGMMRHSARLDEIPGCMWSDQAMRAYDTPICDFDLPVRAAAKCKRDHFKFDAVVSSPFRRCLQTAAIVANYMGLKMLFVDNRLGEVMSKVRSSVRQIKKRNNSMTAVDGEASSGLIEWSYLPRDEAERIAESAGLLLCWDESAHVPPLNESSGAFLQRCNGAKAVVENAQQRWCDPAAIAGQLSDAKARAATLVEELSGAREHVARAAEQLTATFAATLGLGAEVATDRMYDLHSWIQAEDNEKDDDEEEQEQEEEEDEDEALLPVETAYQTALQRVSHIQKDIQATEGRCKLLDESLLTRSLAPWQAALLVTHADIINQRLQHLKPNELYAPRCCGWMVEDLEAKSVLKIMDCDRIM